METYLMTYEQIEHITRLQQSGKGYRAIATETGIPINSVKSWCRRHPIGADTQTACQQCGAPLCQTPGKRQRRFCSDRCRLLWWSVHPECKIGRAKYLHTCRFCGREFTNNRIAASYCSRACFARARAQVASDG